MDATIAKCSGATVNLEGKKVCALPMAFKHEFGKFVNLEEKNVMNLEKVNKFEKGPECGKKSAWSSWIYLWQCVFRLSSLLTW